MLRWLRHHAHDTVRLELLHDDPADALITVAQEQDADLIVVGDTGMSGTSRFLPGSVPHKISHHAPCSVLIVRTS